MAIARSKSQVVFWEEAGVVSTTNSPFCRLKPIPIRAVRMQEGFWKPRMDKNATVTLKSQMQKLRETGVLDNFLRLYDKSDAGFQGRPSSDSDLYKWVEAASWTLQTYKLPEIEKMLNDAIEIIEPAQDDDGYLNTYHQIGGVSWRWTDLDRGFELYCAGHLFQAAVAHHRSTGDDRLLKMACKFADHICEVFGPGKREGHPGHPGIEMALIELYRETGVKKPAISRYFFTPVSR